MKTRASKCDRCGRISESADFWSRVTIKYLSNGEVSRRDLCDPCGDSLELFLAQA